MFFSDTLYIINDIPTDSEVLCFFFSLFVLSFLCFFLRLLVSASFKAYYPQNSACILHNVYIIKGDKLLKRTDTT